MQALLDQGISTRRGVMNIHLEGAYAGQGAHRAVTSLTRSVSAQQQTVILPLYAQMTEFDIIRVVEALRQALADASTWRVVRQPEQGVVPA
jgi:dTDP-4-amino-4,6-dideoxygalactose transaminase